MWSLKNHASNKLSSCINIRIHGHSLSYTYKAVEHSDRKRRKSITAQQERKRARTRIHAHMYTHIREIANVNTMKILRTISLFLLFSIIIFLSFSLYISLSLANVCIQFRDSGTFRFVWTDRRTVCSVLFFVQAKHFPDVRMIPEKFFHEFS